MVSLVRDERVVQITPLLVIFLPVTRKEQFSLLIKVFEIKKKMCHNKLEKTKHTEEI